MELNCLGVLSMAGCSNIISLNHISLEAFLFFLIVNIILIIAFKVRKRKNKITIEREKRADCKNKKGTTPYQKRETKSKSVQAQMPLLKNTLQIYC